MDAINIQYEKIKREKRTGLMAHIVVGYPDILSTRKLANIMSEEGADFIELQIPFSDPLGDGEAIREANTKALMAGIHPKDAFTLVETLRMQDGIATPLLFMTYMNIPFTYGLENFCRDAKVAGVSGLIIPDYNLELEKVDHFDAIARKYGLALCRFVALESPRNRMEFIAQGAEGFVYCFSSQGITGIRANLDSKLIKHLKRARGCFDRPLAVGFGISKPEHVHLLKGHADIVVAGSVVLRAFNEGGFKRARTKVRELVKACIE
ncbi:MAG: tryptophan synthase subunit alpha [bacterium]|nr:tryptophan synthase subunit alpha [bacterium]